MFSNVRLKKKYQIKAYRQQAKGKTFACFSFIQKLEKRFHCCWINVLKAPFLSAKNKF